MINHTAISRLSDSERKGYAWLITAFTCGLAYMLFVLSSFPFKEYQLNKQYANEGIQVEGVVSGFRFFQFTGKNPERFTGHYPNVTFSTPTGYVTLKSDYAHPLSVAEQKAMLGRKVDVRYLHQQPERGRVVQWHRDQGHQTLPLIFLLTAAVAAMAYYARVMWPPKRQPK